MGKHINLTNRVTRILGFLLVLLIVLSSLGFLSWKLLVRMYNASLPQSPVSLHESGALRRIGAHAVFDPDANILAMRSEGAALEGVSEPEFVMRVVRTTLEKYPNLEVVDVEVGAYVGYYYVVFQEKGDPSARNKDGKDIPNY